MGSLQNVTVSVVIVVDAPWDHIESNLLLSFALHVSNTIAKMPQEHVTVQKAAKRTVI